MIKVKLVHKDAKLPFRANPTDAGADLFSVEIVIIPPMERRIVDTGIQIELEETTIHRAVDRLPYYCKYYHQISPRSGLAAKNGIDVFAGICDSSYRGNLKIVLFNSSNEAVHIDVGDRIAQLVTQVIEIHDFIEVDSLEVSVRGESGFGASGK